MAPVKVTDQSFQADVLDSKTPVMVDFWAEWCGPCRQIAPALEELANEYEGKLTVAKVNIDENPQVPTKYVLPNTLSGGAGSAHFASGLHAGVSARAAKDMKAKQARAKRRIGGSGKWGPRVFVSDASVG